MFIFYLFFSLDENYNFIQNLRNRRVFKLICVETTNLAALVGVLLPPLSPVF